MPSPLIQALLEKHGYPVVDEHSIDDFLRSQHEVVLFFSENPVQFPESNDVAVILPELIKHFNGRFQAAVVDRAAEKALQARYGFSTWPALVFLRDGEYLGVITQVQNWEDYLREIKRMLSAEPAKSPAFKIPVVAESTRAC